MKKSSIWALVAFGVTVMVGCSGEPSQAPDEHVKVVPSQGEVTTACFPGYTGAGDYYDCSNTGTTLYNGLAACRAACAGGACSLDYKCGSNCSCIPW